MFTVVVDIEESRARARAAGAARAAAARARTDLTRGPPVGPEPSAGRPAAATEARADGAAWDVLTEKRPLGQLDGRTDMLARALALWRSRRHDGLIPRLADLTPEDLAAAGVRCRTATVEGRPPFARFAEERTDAAPFEGRPVEASWLVRDLLACTLTRVPIYQRLAPAHPVSGLPLTEQLILPLSADGRRITRLLICDQPQPVAESAGSTTPSTVPDRSFG